MTLGPSLSLGNISGVSVKSDMKKRRAPPPPTLPGLGPPVQDKASEKVGGGRLRGVVDPLKGPATSLEVPCVPYLLQICGFSEESVSVESLSFI